MTAVVETFRRVAVVGDLKIVTIQTDATADTGWAIDLNSDVTDGKGQIFEEILNTLAQDDAGADVTGTFTPSTGIYLFGVLTTGIHNVTFIGR